MCDLKPGDDVVCVDAAGTVPGWPLIQGHVYPVLSIGLGVSGDAYLRVTPESHVAQSGWRATRFRKVQRRDLNAWLETSVGNTDKLDKPRRTKKRERA